MDDVPNSVVSSGLYRKLQLDQQLLSGVLSLRTTAESLAETIAKTLPAFTDHTIRHMDSLWQVTDRILTSEEMAKLTGGEAFVLACGFYLHDIGMGYACNEEGANRIRSSPQYQALIASAPENERTELAVQAKALAYAIRALHANAAIELVTKPVPGTSIYLMEPFALREAWGETCGLVAASHNWTIEEVDRRVGSLGNAALPGGRSGDLGYVASILRLVDYAHFGRGRARSIDRALRGPIDADSIVHWLAQQQIDGPERDGADLVYRAAAPIADVDAWWLQYEMLKGLDEEIRTVRRYLDRRRSSEGRLSLQGVRGVTSPEEAAVFVPTSGFLPIEINLRTGSIERLVQLLAGESLYGPEPMAAVRELIQNARDAVMLKAAIASSDFEKASLLIPIRIKLSTSSPVARLEVTDPGIGMTRKVMTDFLISIASDYWSTQFHSDFPNVARKDFEPAGRFGIGFLSVFMLGDSVTVESNRTGGERYTLQLRGVGRRGEIRTSAATSGSGTAVRVQLRQSIVEALKPLDELIRTFAPMLQREIAIEEDGKATSIKPGWLEQLTTDEFCEWTQRASQHLLRGQESRRFRRSFSYDYDLPMHGRRFFIPSELMWRRSQMSASPWPKEWPEYREKGVRLLAGFNGVVILSLKGIAVQSIPTSGFLGIIDIQSASPDVSRRELADADISDVMKRAREGVRPQITKNLEELGGGLLVDKQEFIATCVRIYGRAVVLEASLRWISQLKLPGDLELVSCATLRERLSKARSLFIAYGPGPWTAMKHWVAIRRPNPDFDLAVVVDDTSGTGPGYGKYDEEKLGDLSTLWAECKNSPLFGTILGIAAEAWQISMDDLTTQDGWHHKSNHIWGLFQRP